MTEGVKMAISITLNEYISLQNIQAGIAHSSTAISESSPSIYSLHLPTDEVAKVAILQNQAGQYVLATLPENTPLLMNEINQTLGSEFHLVNEWLLDDLSPEYNQHSIPSMGTAYKMKILLDNALLTADEIFITADDARYLIRIDDTLYEKMAALMPMTTICGSAIGNPQFVETLSHK